MQQYQAQIVSDAIRAATETVLIITTMIGRETCIEAEADCVAVNVHELPQETLWMRKEPSYTSQDIESEPGPTPRKLPTNP